MIKKPIKITDTTLRDAHQSLWATRMSTSDMLPIIGKIDQVGYHSLEMWGGATFDAPLRFLDEDPWDRLRVIKAHVQKTPLQMLLRGQNLVGYRHYGDDIVTKFVSHAATNGIDIFRIFDALNDTRNIKVAAEAVKSEGKHFQGAICYTISPVHTLDHYIETAHKFVEMGADSICIKDMAALLSPYHANSLVTRLKKETDLPIQLHCHYIGGLAPMNYLKAIEAGVDVIDTATVPLAFGNSQPAVEMVVVALKDTPYDPGFDLNLMYEIAEYFEEARERHGYERGVTSLTSMKVFSHQVPGGMISNLESQLKEQKASELLGEVLEEIPIVRAEVGYPPLVTPLSQIVGTQAVINILSGKRWSVIPDEMKSYIKGLYGKPPGPMSSEIVEKVLKGEKPITERPADLIHETLDDFAKEIGDLAKNEEDVLTYALFPVTARAYFEKRIAGVEEDVFLTKEEHLERAEPLDITQLKEIIKAVEASGVSEVVIEEAGKKITVRKGFVGAGEAAEAVKKPAAGEAGGAVQPPVEELQEGWKEIASPMVGTFYRAPSPDSPPYVEEEETVEAGQTLCILEAMKLMNEIPAEEPGVIKKILAESGHPVQYGQVLFYIEPVKE